MKTRLILPVVLVAVLVGGCTAPSMNTRRSALRGGGDLSVVATLDRQDAATAESLVPKIEAACDVIEKHLADVDGLTLGGLVEAVKAEIPAEVAFVTDEIVRRVGANQTQKVLSSDVVKYVLALTRGARRGAQGYATADRPTGE